MDAISSEDRRGKKSSSSIDNEDVEPQSNAQEFWFKSVPAWKCGDPFRHPPPKAEGDPWERCRQIMDEYDEEMCAAWKDEIQSLLIFAGLFSAVVTAFVVESLKSLQMNPSDTTALLLARISAQLEHASVTANTSALFPTIPPFKAASIDVNINILWTISLTLSLATVMIGILCLQWLREYQRKDSTSSHQDAIGLRQMRYNGLMGWRVPLVISTLPLLLQSGLSLFLIGLVHYVWYINHAVAIPLSIFIGITLVVLLATTTLPVFRDLVSLARYSGFTSTPSPCPYKSPQSWAFSQMTYGLITAFNHLLLRLRKRAFNRDFAQCVLMLFRQPHWAQYDQWWRGRSAENKTTGLGWIAKTFRHSSATANTIYQCIYEEQDVQTVWGMRCLIAGSDLSGGLRLLWPYNSRQVTYIRELALYNLLDSLFSFHMYDSNLNPLLLHQSELFLRLSSSHIELLKSNDDRDNISLNKLDVYGRRMFWPRNFWMNNWNTIFTSSSADSLRIQLFRLLDMAIANETGDPTQPTILNVIPATPVQEFMLKLLSTMVIFPLDVASETKSLLEHGFTALTQWLIHFKDTHDAVHFDALCLEIIPYFEPWNAAADEDKLTSNLDLLLEVEPLWDFLDITYGKGCYRGDHRWGWFVSLCRLEERYPPSSSGKGSGLGMSGQFNVAHWLIQPSDDQTDNPISVEMSG